MCLIYKSPAPENLPEEVTAYKVYSAIKLYDSYELVSPIQRYPIKQWGKHSTNKPIYAYKDTTEHKERFSWPINEIPADVAVNVRGFHSFRKYEDALSYAEARNYSRDYFSEIAIVIPVKLIRENIFLYGFTPFVVRHSCGHREDIKAETYVSTEIHISQSDYNKALGKQLEVA